MSDYLHYISKIFYHIKSNPENALSIIKLLLSGLVMAYSLFKLFLHTFKVFRQIFNEIFLILFWGLILTSCLIYFYTNCDDFIKNISIPIFSNIKSSFDKLNHYFL